MNDELKLPVELWVLLFAVAVKNLLYALHMRSKKISHHIMELKSEIAYYWMDPGYAGGKCIILFLESYKKSDTKTVH